MKIKIISSLFALAILFSTSCRKDNSITDTQINSPGPIITILSQVSGMVTNQQGTALSDATVWLGDNSTSTDENGFFSLSGYANSKGAILKVELAGYFTNYHSIQPFENETSRTRVQLMERIAPEQITASSGGSIDVNGGGKVNFEANSFVDEDGTIYTGTVNIYTAYIDPTRPDLAQVMPGNLMALNTANELRLLESFGMINVEMEGEAGQALQINSPATIEVPVPASIRNNAPTEIPLWYFDEESGLWIEEGVAQLNNGIYTGQVSHFTFWNCDVPSNFIELSGDIEAGTFSPEVTVRVTRINNGDFRTATTSDKGKFSGPVPNEEDLLFEVLSKCGTVVHSEQIGPFSADHDMGEIQIDLSSDSWVEISGSVQNCDQEAVENGYVLVINEQASGTVPISIQADGQFSNLVSVCDATEVKLRAVDTDEHKAGEVTLPVSDPIDAGVISACEIEIVSSVVFTINGEEHIIYGCTATPIDETSFYGYTFEFTDSYNNGSVQYKFTILNWTGDPNDPVYGTSQEKTVFGTPDVEYFFNPEVETLDLQLSGSVSGEYVIFHSPNATILNETTLESYSNCTITFTGLIN